MQSRIYLIAIGLAVLLAALRFVPGVRLPSHEIWDFYNAPDMTHDFPWNFNDREDFLNQEFTEMFPAGTNTQDVIDELIRLGFEIDYGSNEARYGWVGYGCFCLVIVSWHPYHDSQDSRIEKVRSYFLTFGLPDSFYMRLPWFS